MGWWVGGAGEIERERRAGDFEGGNSESETQTKLKRACSVFFFFFFKAG